MPTLSDREEATLYSGWSVPPAPFTTNDITPGAFSTALEATDFPLVIPGGVTIVGIKFFVVKGGVGMGAASDFSAFVMKADSPGSDNHALPGAWPGSSTEFEYGADDDLWSLPWTPDDFNLNNPNPGDRTGFGFSLTAFDHTGTDGLYAEVQSIEAEVFYLIGDVDLGFLTGSCEVASHRVTARRLEVVSY